MPTRAGDAVTSGGTGSAPSCATGSTPVLAPTYVSSGVNGKPTVQFSAVNVQVVSGSGSTSGTLNGKGNLIVGYAEDPEGYSQSGSNDLIVGSQNGWASYGQIVAGSENQALSPYASVTGGSENTAGNFLFPGENASVSGGYQNNAVFPYDSVSGGADNYASGGESAIAGGDDNFTGATGSSVSGGYSNAATDRFSTISGGCDNLTGSGNVASNTCDTNGYETVAGGYQNISNGSASSVAGGAGNTAAGAGATVSGGQSNLAFDGTSSIAGGCDNWTGSTTPPAGGCDQHGGQTVSGGEDDNAVGLLSSISGGLSNVASGSVSSISGGLGNIASGELSSILGEQDNTVSAGCGTFPATGGDTCIVVLPGFGAVGAGRTPLDEHTAERPNKPLIGRIRRSHRPRADRYLLVCGGAAGSCTVTQRPPAARGARVRIPSCARVMLLTIARPRPTPAWSARIRCVPR